MNQYDRARVILSRLENEYPTSVYNGKSAHALLAEQGLLSSEGSKYYIQSADISVELISVNEPSREEASVSLSYNGLPEITRYKGGIIADDSGKKITLNSFDENTIYVDYTCNDSAGQTKSQIKFAGNKNFIIPDCGVRIVVNKINLKKVAHVEVIPIVHGRSRESNFTFSIGIEKRAFSMDLTPQEANKKIAELNKQIAEWRNITESLASFIKVEKMACLATTGVINLMNLVSGASGEATARQQVMKNWNAFCDNAANRQPNENSEDCIARNYPTISSEIEQTKTLMKGYNDLYEAQMKNPANMNANGAINDTRVKENIRAKVYEQISPNLQFYDSNNQKVNCTEAYDASKSVDCSKYAQDILDSKNLNSMSYNELADLYYTLGMTRANPQAAGQQSYTAYNRLQQIEQRTLQSHQTSTKLTGTGLNMGDIDSVVTNKQTAEIDYTGRKYSDLTSDVRGALTNAGAKIDAQARVSVATFTGAGTYVYLVDGNENSLQAGTIYKLSNNQATKIFEGGKAVDGLSDELKKEADVAKNVKINLRDAASYKNKCTNCNSVKVFTTEPYKGMINVLPFDCDEGWYVQVKQLFPGLGTGNVKSYQDSGRVNSFWLCNVGKNKLMEGVGVGDDVCRRFDTYTGDTLDSFAGLTQSQARAKVSQAIAAIESAQSKLTSNPTTINVGSCSNLKVKEAEGDYGSKCTDFMTPKQCQLIFNVCDPVVCPNSRCDFGGTYKVDNVIQSGIIGSTFLCLPNFIGFHPNTGVVIPVCLTGIHAGIEGWVSILEAYRDCINESVTNNRTVGICDAVHSVYVCDFFWRQAGPIVQAFTKNIFYAIFGKGDQGGGEYAFVQDSWNNAEKSVQFMQNLYGSNSNLQFGFRDISNIVADEVCKMSASAAYPSKFDAMLEPESPVQFHAFFEEIPYTDVTVPPRSQYKVTYHIYAGNEKGSYYQIYLKSAPTSLGYVGKDYTVVASGYVPQGGRITESKDFLDVAGFKELCVKIDAQDKCGFKTVSTSAALNYATDKAVGSQASENVTSESECIAGSSSLGSLLTPNVQQAAEELVNPELYNQGIIRVCANENPGKSTEPSRWKDVGYCYDRNIRCWIDTNSVKKAIRGKGIENETLANIDNLSIQNLIDQGGYLPETVAISKIKELRDVYFEISKTISFTNLKGGPYSGQYHNYTGYTMDHLDESARLLDKVLVMSSHRAFLSFVKAKAYDDAAVMANKFVNPPKTDSSAGGGTGGGTNVVSGKANCASFTDTQNLSVDFANCIDETKINSLLGSSPMKGMGSITVAYGQSYNVDPIIALAFFNKESNYGTSGAAQDNKNPGNIKFSPACTSARGIKNGDFCLYPTWEAGIEAWFKLISGSAYVGSGMDTVESVIPVYAPSMDNNVPAQYITQVRNYVKTNRVSSGSVIVVK
jgi:hypothetical protein